MVPIVCIAQQLMANVNNAVLVLVSIQPLERVLNALTPHSAMEGHHACHVHQVQVVLHVFHVTHPMVNAQNAQQEMD